MMLIATKSISFIILVTGLALVVRTFFLTGSFSLSAGMVAGLAFTAYGAVRLYYLKGTR